MTERHGEHPEEQTREPECESGGTPWYANIKRTYDEYQNESLANFRRVQAYVDKVLSDAQQNDNVRQNIANQALQNAVENANLVGKQAIRHTDLAIDRQWNVDEVAQLVAQTSTFKDAIAAAVAAAVTAAGSINRGATT